MVRGNGFLPRRINGCDRSRLRRIYKYAERVVESRPEWLTSGEEAGDMSRDDLKGGPDRVYTMNESSHRYPIVITARCFISKFSCPL